MNTFDKILSYFLVLFLGFIVGNVSVGYRIHKIKELEQHNLCYDTAKYEAWVARKEGIFRCFMEYRQYPHRVKASHIDLSSD